MIQLRVRTEYSFGQTYAPLPRLIERLKSIQCTAAGIVDPNTWGHVAWFQACTEAGIQPLLGAECIVTDDDVEAAPRMWFLARDTTGLSELYRWLTVSHRQPLTSRIGSQPRLSRQNVLDMSARIVKFAGNVTDGPFLQQAEAILDVNPSSMVLNQAKRHLAITHSLPLVSTSDNYYACPEDRGTFEFMAKASLKVTPQHLLDTLDHQPLATAISDSCAGLSLPKASMVRATGDLEALCRRGIKVRRLTWTKVYETRLLYELDLIRSKDFASYFLIVADMVIYAKRHMLVGPSRGSAAGSLVCYLTRITEIDPILSELYFERFIDETRTDLPDIDLDFPDDQRHLVFEYMANKYGADNVAHIGNIVCLAPKSALIQVCKALNIPSTATGAVKVAMIERSAADERVTKCLEDTFTTTAPGQQFLARYPQAIAASVIEGHASHTSVHAAGLLVCNAPIQDYATVDAHGIAHIEKTAAETLGLLKIDVLGLRTLSILEDAGVKIDWYHLPMHDRRTFQIFNSGRLCGIFQFEGSAMRSISHLIQFKTIVELDAVTALARPGPFAGGVTQKYIARMNGEKYAPIHPLVAAQMTETYGLPIYQEQTMAIVRDVGGFDWKDTNYIRKAISKRMGEEFFSTFRTKFVAGATQRGMTEGEALATWNLIQTMGSWQMNKAHTRSYAVISYWCAYLKAHHPLRFAASTLRHAKDQDSAMQLLREMTKEGIQYVPFDLKHSQVDWSIWKGKLLGGFMNLRNVGAITAKKYLHAREAGTLTEKQRATILAAANPFADLYPLNTQYQDWYAHPERHQIMGGPIDHIDAFTEGMPHGAERLFIAELVHKNPRNANEDNEIKKRNGVRAVGQLEYLDVRLRDDSGEIGGRVGRREYLHIGVTLSERIPIGAHLLVRAKFWNGIRYAFITDWERLDV